MKKEIIIDGNNFSDRFGLDLEIKRKFTKNIDWVNYNTSRRLNLDSINDFLRGGFGVFELDEDIKVKWINFEKSKKDLGKEETLSYLGDVLEHCHPDNKASVKEKIDLVKNDKGTLLHEMITDILKKDHNIELVLD